MWRKLLKRYWQLATFKIGPEDTPYSRWLLGLLAFLFFSLVVVQWEIVDLKGELTHLQTILSALSLIFSYFIYTFLLLYLYRFPNRLVQTVSALFATHGLLHLLASPLLFLTPLLVNTALDPFVAFLIGFLYLFLTLIITIWQFLITAHIYKHALSIEYLPALLASFGLLSFNILIVSLWR